MVLVDTSIWVAHLKKGNGHLKDLLEEEEVLCHPFVIGELACGYIKNRREILALLHTLPAAEAAEDEEILQFIESNRLMGAGIGLVDVHLLAAAVLSRTRLWTTDRSLRRASQRLRVAYR